jgi:hypothetical protein
MDKNRIEGRHGASRWHNTPKASGMPVEVNAAAVQRSNVQLPGEISSPQGGEKSAEAIVIGETSRSANEHSKIAGRTHPMKGRTDEGGSDREPDTAADTTSRWGGSESLLDGKHGNLQAEPSGLAALRASCPGLVGTAGYHAAARRA